MRLTVKLIAIALTITFVGLLMMCPVADQYAREDEIVRSGLYYGASK